MVSTTGVKSTLIIKYSIGKDEKGKEIFKNQRFGKIKPSAEDENVFTIATALGNFLETSSIEVLRQNDNLIVKA